MRKKCLFNALIESIDKKAKIWYNYWSYCIDEKMGFLKLIYTRNVSNRVKNLHMIRLYTFLIFAAIVVALGYVFFVLPQPTYIFQTQFLVIPQNETVASHADLVVNDLVLISNNAIKNNKDLERFGAQSVMRRIKDHDVMEMSIFLRDQKNISLIERSLIKSAVSDIEKLYDIDSDFDLKVLVRDQRPYKRPFVLYAVYGVIFSITIGVVAGILALFYLLDHVRGEKEYKQMINGKKIFEKYNAINQKVEQKVKVENINEKKKQNKILRSKDVEQVKISQKEKPQRIEEKITNEFEVKKEEIGAMPSSIAVTPGNLPVVDLNRIGFTQKTDAEDEKIHESVDSNVDREPTEEELKARLNALLNGKL